jgi:hypothetical protein
MRLVLICLSISLSGMIFCREIGAELNISPPAVKFARPEASQQMLVTGAASDSRPVDLTRRVAYRVADSRIAEIDSHGSIRPRSDGETELIVTHEGHESRVPVAVRAFSDPPSVSFRNEILPVLTKARCNSGGCHGKAEGQGGFLLSIFGYDAESDHAALRSEGRGRRLRITAPDRSLLVQKGTSRIPHGGGQRIEPGSSRDRLLIRWISEGAAFATESENDLLITGIEVEPRERVLLAGETQQLRVIAIDAEGRRRCVTAEAEYESNAEPIAEVDPSGWIETSDIPGEAAILVRYLGHVATCRVTLPRPGSDFPRPAESNFIDRLAWDKLRRLGIEPSNVCDDATFLRRVSLDVIGTLPTAAEARSFLNDADPEKRSKLIDALLERDEYVDYWSMRWLDLLKADQLVATPQGTVAMQRWLKRHFAENLPFDRFARELLTYQGNTADEGPGAFYKVSGKPEETAQAISQLLLGVRIECARCHHHPSERWTQADFVGLAGFFTGVSLKKLPNGEQAVLSLGGKDVPHPRSGEGVPARALGAAPADFAGVRDRRRVLADWMTSADNPFFARATVNRLWAHYFGRGLVEPIDDLRETNPAVNEPLMQALAEHLHEVEFDLKRFTKTLLNSRLYQLSSTPNDSNRDDARNFSHATDKSLAAEVLLDAICQATGVSEEFNGWPEGYRAIQIWDNRMPSYFFRIFGRPVRATVCECERSDEPSITQALHLLNAPEIAAKIVHRKGRARRLADSELSVEEIVEELFLATLSRYPDARERELVREVFTESDDRRAAVEDTLWAIMNTKEFVFNH